MRRTILAACVIASFLATCERAPRASSITARVVEVGAFETGPGKPGSRETHFTAPGHEFVARLGLKFGFRFRLDNVPDGATIDLKTVVTHPPITNARGEMQTRYTLITTIPVRNGTAMSVTGYSFDRPGEMTPGVWTFEHSYRGKILVTQSFTIRAADAGGTPQQR
jgi:hypothetical protein